MSITEISIKRPTLIVVIFTVLTFLGVVSYQKLNYELLPRYSEPILLVSVVYPGASPSEVENSVTKKVEDAISSLEDISMIKANSYEGFSMVMIMFENGANMNTALREAQSKVNAIEASLPKQSLKPVINNFSMTDIPIMRISITANIDATELYDLVIKRINPMISKVNGVAQLNLIGGESREIRVNINNAKLEANKISILQVVKVIQESNLDFPTGKIKNPNQQFTVRLAGKFQTIDDLKNLVVGMDKNGQSVKLHEIADINDTYKEIKNLNRLNNVNSIGLMIQKKNDGNEVEISQKVKAEIKKLEEIYKDKGLKFTIANDTSDFTMVSAKAVMSDLLIAILLVAAVMLVFLHSLRNSFIILVAIPASLISTFTAMYILNFSLNLMSLIALSLVIGILVDDSIVVLENIYRHLEMGKPRRQASLEGRQEIGFTALSITLVDVVVFLPIAIVESVISGLLRQFALVVVVSTLLSLFVSFTITPLLASRIAKLEHFRKNSLWARIIYTFEYYISQMTNGYARLLVWSLRHKFLVLSVTTLLFFGTLALPGMGFIGSEFVSMGDRGEMIIAIELPKNATLEQTNQTTQKIEKYLKTKREVESVFVTVGSGSDFFATGSTAYKSELHIKLVDKKKRKLTAEKYSQLWKAELQRMITEAKIRSNIVSLVGTSDMEPIQLVVSGPNLDSLIHYAGKIMDAVKKVPGTSGVKLSVEGGIPEVNVEIDKRKMAELGLTMDIVGATMQTAYAGNTDAKFKTAEREYDINIIFDAFDRKSMDDIAQLTFINMAGQVIKLNQFAVIKPSTGTSALERYNRVPSITVLSNVVNRPIGTVGEEIMQQIDKIHLPKEISISNEGDLKYQDQAFGSLGIAFLASILFVYLIMVALYDSYIYPFVVLFSIPLAIVGALLALALTMQSLNIFSILGIIMLVGLVGKNAILLVDFTNQMKQEGHQLARSLVAAGKVRLRPILMTTLAMIAGMLPIAVAKGAGSEWKNGMGWVLIGGLLSSLLLTLVIVPVVYSIVDALKSKVMKKKETARQE